MPKCHHNIILDKLAELDVSLEGDKQLSPLQKKFITTFEFAYLRKHFSNLSNVHFNKRKTTKRTNSSCISDIYFELKRKIPELRCRICSYGSGSRLVLCFECDDAYCKKAHHARQHSYKHDHHIGLNIGNLHLECTFCGYVGTRRNIKLLEDTAILQLFQLLRGEKVQDSLEILHRKLIEEEKSFQTFNSVSCVSLRGIKNIGNTCFMNVILQVLVHNPVLRDQYLKLDRKRCPKGKCISCELHQFFINYYSGDFSPMLPITLLETMWNSSERLAGYAQQDAHEFFMAILNQVHEDELNHHDFDDHTPNECNCIIHSTFGGELRSSVVCLACNQSSDKGDPFLDNALDLREPKRRRTHKGGTDKDSKKKVYELGLNDCLEGFTHKEVLTPGSYRCEKCKSQSKATKQMVFQRLAPILSFQLKRYSHDNTSSAAKLDTSIQLPLKLDMAPYSTPDCELPSTTALPNSTEVDRVGMFHYRLFGVVHHIGSLDAGHYTVNIYHKGKWYEFDDHICDIVNEEDVLNNKAYLCYYIKVPNPLPL